MHKWGTLLLLGSAMLLASCWLAESTGRSAHVDTTIRFELPDKSPAQQVTVSLSEVFASVETHTHDLQTDERGEIRLAGYYCAPLVIMTLGRGATRNRGWIVIEPGNYQPYYTVILDLDEYRAAGGGNRQDVEESAEGGGVAMSDTKDRSRPQRCF